jgi:hypothetical protein
MNFIIFSLWPSYPSLRDSPIKLFCTFELPKKNGMEKLVVFRQTPSALPLAVDFKN